MFNHSVSHLHVFSLIKGDCNALIKYYVLNAR